MVNAPLSELAGALSAKLNAIADELGPIAGAAYREAAEFVDAVSDITPSVFDFVDVTIVTGAGTLAVVCFTKGTHIQTENGYVPVESLAVGDKVKTRDNGLQEIRWIGSNIIGKTTLWSNPRLYPIRIKKAYWVKICRTQTCAFRSSTGYW